GGTVPSRPHPHRRDRSRRARLSPRLNARLPVAKVRIAWDGGEVIANLRDTPTATQLLAALPCASKANTWGEEVYFEVPFQAALEGDARQVVDPGTLCYWVDGKSLALPFGRTPISKGSESRLVSPCNV